MKINIKSVFVSLAIMFVCLVMVNSVKAVPNPEAIRWNASPTAFVTSLYVGVLGRSPRPTDPMQEWARRITRKPESRIMVFHSFLIGTEYKSSRWAKQPKLYTVYKEHKTFRTKRSCDLYTASKSSRSSTGVKIYVGGPWNFGIALATVGYINAYGKNTCGIARGGGIPLAQSTTVNRVPIKIFWINSVHNKIRNPIIGERYTFRCLPKRVRSSMVVGTDIYKIEGTSICYAAVHAGVISLQKGGTFTIEIRKSIDRFVGSTRNGIPSQSDSRVSRWESFVFVR